MKESGQGFEDLDENGNVNGEVIFSHDPVTGIVRNLRLSAFRWGVEDGIVAVRVNETAGNDLNGDGDTNDTVVQVVDPRTRAITNTGLALGNELNNLAAGGGVVYVGVSEPPREAPT